MANKTIKEVLDAVYTSISTNATLSAYVKSFLNNPPAVQSAFPMVYVASIRFSVDEISHGQTGKDLQNYRIELIGVVKNLADDRAFYGTATEKGAIQLCEDMYNACHSKDFGVFHSPVIITECGPFLWGDGDNGFMWLARVAFEGKVWNRRS